MMNNSTRNTIDAILRDELPRELPYGFAARVAQVAMTAVAARTMWEILLELSPRTTFAVGAVASLLVVYGMTGGGVDIVDAVTSYSVLSEPLPLP